MSLAEFERWLGPSALAALHSAFKHAEPPKNIESMFACLSLDSAPALFAQFTDADKVVLFDILVAIDMSDHYIRALNDNQKCEARRHLASLEKEFMCAGNYMRDCSTAFAPVRRYLYEHLLSMYKSINTELTVCHEPHVIGFRYDIEDCDIADICLCDTCARDLDILTFWLKYAVDNYRGVFVKREPKFWFYLDCEDPVVCDKDVVSDPKKVISLLDKSDTLSDLGGWGPMRF